MICKKCLPWRCTSYTVKMNACSLAFECLLFSRGLCVCLSSLFQGAIETVSVRWHKLKHINMHILAKPHTNTHTNATTPARHDIMFNSLRSALLSRADKQAAASLSDTAALFGARFACNLYYDEFWNNNNNNNIVNTDTRKK